MKRGHKQGKSIIAFGAGLLLACICPTEWLVAILAIILVISGAASLLC